MTQLADTLILKHQQESAKTNNYLVHLTKDTVDDSATVRVVTFVTLVYLPASFIAVCFSIPVVQEKADDPRQTIFGMNLFSFDTETSRVRVAGDFWIYVAICVPLTVFTVGYWFLQSRSRSSKNKRIGQNLELALRAEKV